MKGDFPIWRMFWLFAIVVSTFLLVITYGPGTSRIYDQAIDLNARYQGMQFAGALASLQNAPDGVEHDFRLPGGGSGCLLVYKTYVNVKTAGAARVDFLESEIFDAKINFPAGEPVSVDCGLGSVKLKKEGGMITIG